MTIEELVRAELRSVAEQVTVPSLPSLEEPRRSWRVVVAAAAAVVLVIGGLTFLLRDEADLPERPIEKPKIDHVDRSAPTIPWIDGDRLFVEGRRIPGRWLEVYSGGHTWLARRSDRRVFWGRGTQLHELGRAEYDLAYAGPYLSRSGRYLAVGFGTYLGVGFGTGLLVDTSTGRSRTVPLSTSSPDPSVDEWVAGVTDTGVVLSTRAEEGSAESYAIRAGQAPLRLETQGGYLTRTVASGLLLEDTRRRVWVVDVVGSRVRRVAQVSSDRVGPSSDAGLAASLSTDREWLLDLGWSRDRDEPETLPVTAVDDGHPAPVSAPQGWVFAPQLAPGFWEPEGTLVTFVVRPESREYRAVRCAPVSGECVLLEES